MRRREFVTLLAAAVAGPDVARAQKPALPIIGFLNSSSLERFGYRLPPFREGLKEAGFVEGSNVAIEYRWANDQYDRLPTLVAELLQKNVAVIVSLGNIAGALAAKAATATIPIVFQAATDPVQIGLVASLARPGGNVTGVVSLNVEVAPKRLQLLRETVPTATRFALLVNPRNSAFETQVKDMRKGAATLGLELLVLEASDEQQIVQAFATMDQMRVGGLVIGPDVTFSTRSAQLAALAMRYKLPTAYQFREFATAGGLISYGGNLTESYHWAGVYAGRVLRGEKPAEMPIWQAQKVELFVNLNTAKSLGIVVPPIILLQANEVIE
jgi:putative ABC transport system substrate-binding protein